MNSKSLGKKLFVLVFLLVILAGVFIAQDDSFGGGYFEWLKMKLTGLGPELNLAKEDSGLDMTSIDIDALLAREETALAVKEEDEFENLEIVVNVEEEIEEDVTESIENSIIIEEASEKLVVAPVNTQEKLLKIKIELDKIGQEVDRIYSEVQNLLASQEVTQNL